MSGVFDRGSGTGGDTIVFGLTTIITGSVTVAKMIVGSKVSERFEGFVLTHGFMSAGGISELNEGLERRLGRRQFGQLLRLAFARVGLEWRKMTDETFDKDKDVVYQVRLIRYQECI